MYCTLQSPSFNTLNAACWQLLMAYGWMFRPRNTTIYCNCCKHLYGHQGDIRISRKYWLLKYVLLHLISSVSSRTVRVWTNGGPLHSSPAHFQSQIFRPGQWAGTGCLADAGLYTVQHNTGTRDRQLWNMLQCFISTEQCNHSVN